MTKTYRNLGFLSMVLTSILSLFGYYFWTSEGKNIFLAIASIAIIAICFLGVFASVKKARSAYDKVLTALIGNIMLNLLFIVALYFVVITFIR